MVRAGRELPHRVRLAAPAGHRPKWRRRHRGRLVRLRKRLAGQLPARGGQSRRHLFPISSERPRHAAFPGPGLPGRRRLSERRPVPHGLLGSAHDDCRRTAGTDLRRGRHPPWPGDALLGNRLFGQRGDRPGRQHAAVQRQRRADQRVLRARQPPLQLLDGPRRRRRAHLRCAVRLEPRDSRGGSPRLLRPAARGGGCGPQLRR